MQAVVVTRGIITHDNRILFIQRSQDSHNNPGRFELPGGKVDPGETILEALHRELFEEVSLKVQPIQPPVAGPTYIIPDGEQAGALYLPLYIVCQAPTSTTRLSAEHQQAIWLTYKQATEQARDNLTEQTKDILNELAQWLA